MPTRRTTRQGREQRTPTLERKQRRAARVRLDTPRDPRRRVPRPTYDPESFGRFSERIARFIGTGRFLVYMTLVVVTWVVWNVFAPDRVRFDNYPFIFLTLALSLQASYAAPLILLAQNRQTDRDRVQYEQDRDQNDRSVADAEYLTREVAAVRIALGDMATRDFIRSELRDLLEELLDQDEPNARPEREPTT
jgi:uncharacterized membrane protein